MSEPWQLSVHEW